jgi:hypothetical protein
MADNEPRRPQMAGAGIAIGAGVGTALFVATDDAGMDRRNG